MKAIINDISEVDSSGFFEILATIENDKGDTVFRDKLTVSSREQAIGMLKAKVDSIKLAETEASLFAIGEVINLN